MTSKLLFRILFTKLSVIKNMRSLLKFVTNATCDQFLFVYIFSNIDNYCYYLFYTHNQRTRKPLLGCITHLFTLIILPNFLPIVINSTTDKSYRIIESCRANVRRIGSLATRTCKRMPRKEISPILMVTPF